MRAKDIQAEGRDPLPIAAQWARSTLLMGLPSWSSRLYGPALLLLALALRLPMMQRGLTVDETDTALYATSRPFWQIISDPNSLNNHIGYTVTATVAEAMFGHRQWVLRLPALLMGLLSLYALWWLARSIGYHDLALVPPLLLSLSPVHIAMSTSARGYSGLILFTLLSTIFYFRLLRSPSRQATACFVLTSAIGIYCHLYSGFVVLVQALFWLYRIVHRGQPPTAVHRQRWAELRLYTGCFAGVALLSALLYLPALRAIVANVRYSGRGEFQPWLPWETLQWFAGTESLPIVLLLLVTASIGAMVWRRQQAALLAYCLMLLSLPLVIVWLARPVFLFPRFFLYWLPYWCILLTAGGAWLWSTAQSFRNVPARWLFRTGLVYIAAVIIATWSVNWWRWPALYAETSYREVSMLALLRDADATVGLCSIGQEFVPWEFYSSRPLFHPRSIAELVSLGQDYQEIRCLDTNLEADGRAEIAMFLAAHGRRERIFVADLYYWNTGEIP